MDQTDPRAAAFRTAVESGDADAVRSIFADHPELNAVIDAPWFSFGSPAVSHAAGARNRPLLDALLDLGADPEVMSVWENGPYSTLHRLVDGATPESLELAEHVISRGAFLDLHTAAGLGRLDRVREILDAEPDRVSESGPDGATPLHLARNVEVAALLLERGAEIDKRCLDHRSTAAMWAAGNRPEVLRFLAERGTTPDLYMAVLLDDVDLAARILDGDPAAIDVRVRFGRSHEHVGFGDKYVWTLHGAETPVELARVKGRAEMYAYLLERSSPATRLLQAARREEEDAMREVFSSGPEVLVEMPAEDVCQLLCASAVGTRVALEHGADPDARDDGGATALHHAAWRGLADVIAALLEGGANRQLRDRQYDATPVGWANESGQRRIMDILLEHEPADLVDASWLGDVARVSSLLKNDPSLAHTTEDGRASPLRGAAFMGHTEIVRLLLEYGADPSVPNPSDGRTALDYAREKGHSGIVEMLSDL